MTKQEWNDFIDNGSVTDVMLVNIAKKIREHKTLDEKELSVYKEHSHIIERLVILDKE